MKVRLTEPALDTRLEGVSTKSHLAGHLTVAIEMMNYFAMSQTMNKALTGTSSIRFERG